MDIFTTQLTRVVPVKIQPSTLKVKALAKDAATSKLTEDDQHLEHHPDYQSNKTIGKITSNKERQTRDEQSSQQENVESDTLDSSIINSASLGAESSNPQQHELQPQDGKTLHDAEPKHLVDLTDESEGYTEQIDGSAKTNKKAKSLAEHHKPPHLDIFV